MLRQLEQIPYVKDFVKHLRRNPYLRRVCGYGDRVPCEVHFTQMNTRIGVEGFRLGYVEALLNVNEKQLVEKLLTRVLSECIEVELIASDSQIEASGLFGLLEFLKIGSVIAWRRMKGRENPPDVLSVKDRIDVEGHSWMRVVY